MTQDNKRMTVRSRYNSFGYAIQGFFWLLKKEPNMRIHALASVAAVGLGIYKHINPGQWIAVVFAIALVWITEAVNTAIETLCDLHSKEYNPQIKIIKDVSAFAVLAAAIASVIIGVIVFIL